MAFDWRNAVQRLLYGHGTYPALDLMDASVLMAQKSNIAMFKARWRRVMLGFLLAPISMPGLPLLAEHFADPRWFKEHGSWLMLPFFIAVLATIIFMFRYKCPHCSTVPSGVNWGVGADGVASFSKGIHLFPVRCTKCGYYLATRALRKDLRRMQTPLPANNSRTTKT
jgi:hypothetical protein